MKTKTNNNGVQMNRTRIYDTNKRFLRDREILHELSKDGNEWVQKSYYAKVEGEHETDKIESITNIDANNTQDNN